MAVFRHPAGVVSHAGRIQLRVYERRSFPCNFFCQLLMNVSPTAVREGLTSRPKRLPAWLFYDAAGSRLFDEITELPEYYLTRTERAIFAAHADEIVAQAADGARLRIAELGRRISRKNAILLHAAIERQRTVVYEPIDVSASALDGARKSIEREIRGVSVAPRVMDYTQGDGAAISSGTRKPERTMSGSLHRLEHRQL